MLYISPAIRRLIDLALDEDDIGFDVTSGIFFADAVGTARMIAKEPIVISGHDVVREVFARVDPEITFTPLIPDGERAEVGDVVGRVEGPAVSMLRGERTALNFLQRMSGVATLTRQYVDALGNTRVRMVDTRKTLPGYRELDKYAVRSGGGYNHRFALSGGVMVKDNHIAAVGSIEEAVMRVRAAAPHTLRVEVEVSTGDDALRAIDAGAEIVMLDNMGTDEMRAAIEKIRAHPMGKRTIVEVSGNVTLERLPELGQLDVDVVSSGSLTHSIKAADISMKMTTRAVTREE